MGALDEANDGGGGDVEAHEGGGRSLRSTPVDGTSVDGAGNANGGGGRGLSQRSKLGVGARNSCAGNAGGDGGRGLSQRSRLRDGVGVGGGGDVGNGGGRVLSHKSRLGDGVGVRDGDDVSVGGVRAPWQRSTVGNGAGITSETGRGRGQWQQTRLGDGSSVLNGSYSNVGRESDGIGSRGQGQRTRDGNGTSVGCTGGVHSMSSHNGKGRGQWSKARTGDGAGGDSICDGGSREGLRQWRSARVGDGTNNRGRNYDGLVDGFGSGFDGGLDDGDGPNREQWQRVREGHGIGYGGGSDSRGGGGSRRGRGQWQKADTGDVTSGVDGDGRFDGGFDGVNCLDQRQWQGAMEGLVVGCGGNRGIDGWSIGTGGGRDGRLVEDDDVMTEHEGSGWHVNCEGDTRRVECEDSERTMTGDNELFGSKRRHDYPSTPFAATNDVLIDAIPIKKKGRGFSKLEFFKHKGENLHKLEWNKYGQTIGENASKLRAACAYYARCCWLWPLDKKWKDMSKSAWLDTWELLKAKALINKNNSKGKILHHRCGRRPLAAKHHDFEKENQREPTDIEMMKIMYPEEEKDELERYIERSHQDHPNLYSKDIISRAYSHVVGARSDTYVHLLGTGNEKTHKRLEYAKLQASLQRNNDEHESTKKLKSVIESQATLIQQQKAWMQQYSLWMHRISQHIGFTCPFPHPQNVSDFSQMSGSTQNNDDRNAGNSSINTNGGVGVEDMAFSSAFGFSSQAGRNLDLNPYGGPSMDPSLCQSRGYFQNQPCGSHISTSPTNSQGGQSNSTHRSSHSKIGIKVHLHP